MVEAPLLGGSKKVKLDDGAFGAAFNEPLVHQSVRAEQAARRRGTAATKTRGKVSGGGRKPWGQKGSGRARAGSTRSPLWAGGGITFGPQPRSYTFKVNRKEHRAALRSALSLHAQRGSMAVLDPSVFTEPKTSQAADLLDDWRAPQELLPALVVLSPEESDAALSFRNLARVSVLAHEDVGVTDLIAAATLVISSSAIDSLSPRAKSGERAGVATDEPIAVTPAKRTTARKAAATKTQADAPPSSEGEHSSEGAEQAESEGTAG